MLLTEPNLVQILTDVLPRSLRRSLELGQALSDEHRGAFISRQKARLILKKREYGLVFACVEAGALVVFCVLDGSSVDEGAGSFEVVYG